jgi:hypothetical protein
VQQDLQEQLEQLAQLAQQVLPPQSLITTLQRVAKQHLVVQIKTP